MSIELKFLVWSVALAFAQMLLTVTGAIFQVGLPTLTGNRDKRLEYTGWVGRSYRAIYNMLENLAADRRPDQCNNGARRRDFLFRPSRLCRRLPHWHPLPAHFGMGRFAHWPLYAFQPTCISSRWFSRHSSLDFWSKTCRPRYMPVLRSI